MQTSLSSNWRHFDFWLFGAVVVLTIFGITMIRSAVAGNIELTTETNLVNRQITFTVVGFVAMFLTASIDYHYWSSVSRVMYLGTAVALVILNVIAQTVFGSARWFQVLTINIQPSEIAKIVIILVLADFFTQNYDEVGNLRIIRLCVRTLNKHSRSLASSLVARRAEPKRRLFLEIALSTCQRLLYTRL